MDWIWVATGGAVGSTMRYGMTGAVQRWGGGGWPIGTLAVNVVGSFAIGFLGALFLARGDAPSQARLLLLVGVLGGFTTFSTFSLDTLRLAQQGSWWPAFLNVALSVGGSLGAAWAGYAVAVRM